MIWSDANESRLKELEKKFESKRGRHTNDPKYSEFLALRLKKQRIKFVNAQPD